MSASDPTWSVVVPTYQRPLELAACLAALARLDPPAGGFEVVIVNDGGIEPAARVRAMDTGSAGAFRFLGQPNAGPAAARNRGARAAAGSRLAFTDDDCEPEPAWLRAFERALDAQPDALAGGVVINAVADSVFSEASQILAGFVAGWFDGVGGRERFFTSNNIAVERAAFHDAGGFATSFGTAAGEDREFCDRWSAQQRPSLAITDAVVRHAHALTLRSFLRQHFAYGRGARLFRRVRRSTGRPVRIDPGFYIASLRHAARGRPVGHGAALAACTLVAHAAYLIGLALPARRPARV